MAILDIDDHIQVFPVIKCEPEGTQFQRTVELDIKTWLANSNAGFRVFSKKSHDSPWLFFEKAFTADRKINLEINHFTEFLITIKKAINYVCFSKIYVSNSVYHDKNGNFTSTFTLDEKELKKQIERRFSSIKFERTFPMEKVMWVPLNSTVNCVISIIRPRGFSVFPEDGFSFIVDKDFRQHCRSIQANPPNPLPTVPFTFLLKYSLHANENEISNDSQALLYPLLDPEQVQSQRADSAAAVCGATGVRIEGNARVTFHQHGNISATQTRTQQNQDQLRNLLPNYERRSHRRRSSDSVIRLHEQRENGPPRCSCCVI
ncbi:uncharacterized protein LOC120338461 isoform X1 [Styela clava]